MTAPSLLKPQPKEVQLDPKTTAIAVLDLNVRCDDPSDICSELMKGLGGGIVELVAEFDGDTYRAVYTVRFREAVYVLHAFMKKSKRGIKTPKSAG